MRSYGGRNPKSRLQPGSSHTRLLRRTSLAVAVTVGATVVSVTGARTALATTDFTTISAPFTAAIDYATGFPFDSFGNGVTGVLNDGQYFYATDNNTLTTYRFPAASGGDATAAVQAPGLYNGLTVGRGSPSGVIYYGVQAVRSFCQITTFDPATLALGPPAWSLRNAEAADFCDADNLNPVGLTADPLTSDIYFSASNQGIWRVQNPGPANTFSQFVGGDATGSYVGLAFTSDGQHLWAAFHGQFSSYLAEFSRAGVVEQTISLNASGHPPAGIAIASSTAPNGLANNVFINDGDGTIVRVDPSSQAVTVVASGGKPGNLATVGPDGCMYVTQTDRVEKMFPCFFTPPPYTFDSRPTVDAGSGYSGAEGSAIALKAHAADGDGDAVTTVWSVAGSPEPGASCSFGDATSLTSSVTCNEEGSYTLNLNATDGTTAAVNSTTTVLVTDVAPQVTIVSPASNAILPVGSTTVTASFTDGGTLDSHACTVQWDSGATVAAAISAEPTQLSPGGCVASINGLAPGSHTATISVEDSDSTLAGSAAVSFSLNAPPVLSLPGTQSVQYSDALSFGISATDSEPADTVTLGASGLPSGLAFIDNGDRTGTVSGTAQVAAGSYTATFTANDGVNLPVSGTVVITVTREDAVVVPANGNPSAIQVATAGGNAGAFTLTAAISEQNDDATNGDISLAVPVTFALVPVGSGTTYTCTATTSGGGVGGTLTATCNFAAGVAVNLYDVRISVGGSFYSGSGDGVLAVYDPSLGFTTGGGWILHNGAMANFGFVAKYLKSGQIQGNVLYIEHAAGGDVILKSNAMTSLVITGGNTAYLSGKATVNGVGNYSFRVTAIDNGTGGTSDQFGLSLTDPSGSNVGSLTFVPITLSGGNIVVPHST